MSISCLKLQEMRTFCRILHDTRQIEQLYPGSLIFQNSRDRLGPPVSKPRRLPANEVPHSQRRELIRANTRLGLCRLGQQGRFAD